jgi:hypothetical protein
MAGKHGLFVVSIDRGYPCCILALSFVYPCLSVLIELGPFVQSSRNNFILALWQQEKTLTSVTGLFTLA